MSGGMKESWVVTNVTEVDAREFIVCALENGNETLLALENRTDRPWYILFMSGTAQSRSWLDSHVKGS